MSAVIEYEPSIRYYDCEQRSDEWNKLRLGMVTASAVGRLLTPTLKIASNDDSRGLLGTIVAERITGQAEPSFINDDMLRGILHEPFARDRYAEHNKVTVREIGFVVRDDLGFEFGASPDGLVGSAGGIEVKCPRAKTHIRTIVADQVPPQYLAQVQASLLVTGRDWWDFISFCAGLPMWTKRVYPDPAWQEAIVEAVTSFEAAAAEMVGKYREGSKDLPATEAIPDLEVVI